MRGFPSKTSATGRLTVRYTRGFRKPAWLAKRLGVTGSQVRRIAKSHEIPGSRRTKGGQLRFQMCQALRSFITRYKSDEARAALRLERGAAGLHDVQIRRLAAATHVELGRVSLAVSELVDRAARLGGLLQQQKSFLRKERGRGLWRSYVSRFEKLLSPDLAERLILLSELRGSHRLRRGLVVLGILPTKPLSGTGTVKRTRRAPLDPEILETRRDYEAKFQAWFEDRFREEAAEKEAAES